jgi:hypothetical protein
LVWLAASGVADAEVRIVMVRPGEVDIAPAAGAELKEGVMLTGSRLLGEIVAVHDKIATVKLPVNVVAHVGDVVHLEGRHGGGVDVWPPRPVGLAITGEIQIGPGFPFCLGGCIGSGGLQTVSSAEIVYRAPQPFALRATLAHAALTFASPSNIAAVDFTAGASFDEREIEIGLSFGAASYNESYAGATTAFVIEPLLRIGAVDGVSLTTTGQVGFVNVNATGGLTFNAIGVFGVLSIPVGDRWWLLERIGVSLDGYAHVDGAVRVLVRGNGSGGSLFMLVSAGAVATYFTGTSQTLFGPSFGLGVEVRP